jgi:hypothetical protein
MWFRKWFGLPRRLPSREQIIEHVRKNAGTCYLTPDDRYVGIESNLKQLRRLALRSGDGFVYLSKSDSRLL